MSGHSLVNKYAGESENTIGAREPLLPSKVAIVAQVVAELVSIRKVDLEIDSV